ncbi:hypothetical protein SKAU_G00205390 [Synaphobranchus kaupii]|uniref:Uncharacterized protein n=1 Tax=Synaphobranchus kaupii TaxID=118154 RepID=A0A9Q1IYS5_SYNKA|nr:hypothetical protein SKAU_G00205390 [Synaphobranchus kaupii]
MRIPPSTRFIKQSDPAAPPPPLSDVRLKTSARCQTLRFKNPAADSGSAELPWVLHTGGASRTPALPFAHMGRWGSGRCPSLWAGPGGRCWGGCTCCPPTLPVTLLYGARSWVDSSTGLRVAQLRPHGNTSVVIVQGASHHVYADQPGEFNRVVEKICDSVD